MQANQWTNSISSEFMINTFLLNKFGINTIICLYLMWIFQIQNLDFSKNFEITKIQINPKQNVLFGLTKNWNNWLQSIFGNTINIWLFQTFFITTYYIFIIYPNFNIKFCAVCFMNIEWVITIDTIKNKHFSF